MLMRLKISNILGRIIQFNYFYENKVSKFPCFGILTYQQEFGEDEWVGHVTMSNDT